MLFPNQQGHESADANPLPPGTSLGNYVLGDRIGYGTMGAVYRAEHTLLRKAVAVKVMAAPLLDDADARERFLREGQTAAALKHPNVVDVTDVGVAGTTPFLVMELLEGEDLEAFLDRREKLEEWEVAELIVPIVAALASAHDQGVVHRDLKPSNIFVARGSDGTITPMVLDFGICKLAQTLGVPDLNATPFNQLLGSPSYLAPETLKGSGHVSDKCDQYSLGVVLYECIAGRQPFRGESLYSLLCAIRTGEFASPKESRPDVSPLMEDIILRAMKADPESRYRDMRELGRALLEVARPRTQILWGPSFGSSEPSVGVTGENTGLQVWMSPPREAPRVVQSRRRSRLKHLAWAAVLGVVGYVVSGLRSTWEAPVASAVNADPAWLAPVEMPAEADSLAALSSAESVPQPLAANVVRDPVESRAATPSDQAAGAEAREATDRKAGRRAALRKSKRRSPRASIKEAEPRAGLGQLDRAAVGLDQRPSGTAIANEAPILD